MEVGQTLQILLKYVKHYDDGRVDATGIVGRECFEHWKRTRNPKPRHPEEAFRKIITAHCRGDCGMNSFPPKVEESLLTELRLRKVWKCFSESPSINIGLRGFQTNGYWEKQRSEEQRQTLLLEAHKRQVKINIPLSAEQSFSSEDFDLASKFYQLFINSGTKEGESLKAVMSILTFYRSKYFAQLLMVIMYKKGNLTSQRPIKVSNTFHEFFFKKEFACPKGEERIFDSSAPIGSVYGNIVLCTTHDTDYKSKQQFKGDITNKVWSTLRVFPQQMFLFQQFIMFDIFTNGSSWQRTIEYRLDGSPMVMLHKYTQVKKFPDFVFIQSQDITTKYAKLLAL